MSLGPDGRVESRTSIEDALAMDKILSTEVAKEINGIENAKNDIDAEMLDDIGKSAAGKLVVEEEIHEGRVSWAARECTLLFSYTSRNQHRTFLGTFRHDVSLQRRRFLE